MNCSGRLRHRPLHFTKLQSANHGVSMMTSRKCGEHQGVQYPPNVSYVRSRTPAFFAKLARRLEFGWNLCSSVRDWLTLIPLGVPCGCQVVDVRRCGNTLHQYLRVQSREHVLGTTQNGRPMGRRSLTGDIQFVAHLFSTRVARRAVQAYQPRASVTPSRRAFSSSRVATAQVPLSSRLPVATLFSFNHGGLR